MWNVNLKPNFQQQILKQEASLYYLPKTFTYIQINWTTQSTASPRNCQGGKIDVDLLTLWPKINRVPPLINHNLHMKFESDWTFKKNYCSLYCAHKALYMECQNWPWPFDPMTHIQYCPSSHHPQLTCEVWKWLGKNCSRYRVHKVKNDGLKHSPTNALTHLTQPPTNGRVTISPPMLLQGDNKKRSISTNVWGHALYAENVGYLHWQLPDHQRPDIAPVGRLFHYVTIKWPVKWLLYCDVTIEWRENGHMESHISWI